MTMISRKPLFLAVGALALGGAVVAQAQAPAGAGRKAVEERQAVYKLIGANFRTLGAVLKGEAEYDAADANKRLARIALLAPYTSEVFPAVSNIGEPDTKARPEVWSQKADFEEKQKAFVADVAALVAVNAKDQAFTEPVKTALTKVAQDCKACHEDFKIK